MALLADSPVPVTRLHGSTDESWDEQGYFARESFKIAKWSDRWKFLLWADGAYTQIGGSKGPVSIYTPLQYPDQPAMYAVRIGLASVGASTDPLAPYDHCRADVEFRTPPFNFEDSVWLSEDWGGSANFFTLPNRPYHFADGTPVPSDVGRLVPQIEVSLTRHRVPSLSLVSDKIFSLAGYVNSVPFRGWDVGQVMFPGAETNFQGYWSGMFSFDVKYRFIYRPVPWNEFLNPTTSDFEVITDGNGNKVYPADDLNQLFNPFA